MGKFKKELMMRFDQLIYSKIPVRQKEAISNLLTEKQKTRLKKLLGTGTFHQHIRLIADYREKLTTQGFREKALSDLYSLYNESAHPHLKSLAGYEIILFHGNEGTEQGYKNMLDMAEEMLTLERDPDRLRKLTIMMIEGLERTGDKEKAKAIADRLLKTTNHPDAILARTNIADSSQEKEYYFNQLYHSYSEIPVTLNANVNAEHLYDRLDTADVESKTHSNRSAKVSIIMPAYNAAGNIGVAIESLLKQSWEDIELIIVDDCSTDNTLAVCKDYESRDQRVKVLQTSKNSGAYVARNTGLKVASGEYITVNDSDDWSHARKIEIQVAHLIKNPHIAGNFSLQARLANDLTFYRRGKLGEYIFKNFSSLMFRRKMVLDKLGYWDSVRFAGDSEFVQRILRVFGEKSLPVVDAAPMSFQRQSEGSLTSSSAFGYPGYFMGARKEYREAHQHYHAHALMDDLFYDFPQRHRPFPAPYPMLPEREKGCVRHFGLVVAGDFRVPTSEKPLYTELLSGIAEKTGIIQIYDYSISQLTMMDETVREKLAGNQVSTIVFGETVTCDQIIISNIHALKEKQIYLPEVQAEHVAVLFRTPLISEQGFQSAQDLLLANENLKIWLGENVVWYPENHDAVNAISQIPEEVRKDMNIAETVFKKS